MDRETLVRAIDEGPVRVTMHDGSYYDIPDHKSAMVDSAICYVLTRSENGKLQAVWRCFVGTGASTRGSFLTSDYRNGDVTI